MNETSRHAIVDIGSNSIRLVVFGGRPRAPVVLFNEKLMAGLGRGVVAGGRFDPESAALALAGLARFAAMLRLMQPLPVQVVATAAVREAADGGKFLAAVRALGLPAEILSGEAEADAAGYGVISALPEADGLVADLGGGSLELVRVKAGQVHERTSLPLGAMRVASIRAGGTGRLRKFVRARLAELEWIGAVRAKPIYLVGGAWRTLARVHMQIHGWPLPVLGNYTFPAADAAALKAEVRAMGTVQLAAIPGVKMARALQLDDAAALLAALVAEAGPSQVTISTFGLREGLLFQALDPATQLLDPLIEGVRHAVAGQQQVPGYSEALLGWSDAIFPDEAPQMRRLRHAACLLFATGWASSPDFRVLEGKDLALHGNWIGVAGPARALMAMALHVSLGGNPDNPPKLLSQLAGTEPLGLARSWGLAMRLAQRLSGGSPAVLLAVPIALAPDRAMVLSVPREVIGLVDAGVERRLARLALSLGRAARVESAAEAGIAPEKKSGVREKSSGGGGRRRPA